MKPRVGHLNSFSTFESAARLESYSKAADELYITQAAVSQQMRTLENTLGVKLFVRTGRKMQLTQSGETLFASVSQAFESLEQGIAKISNQSANGELVVTSTQSFCSLWLMPRLYRFYQLYPSINVKIVGSNRMERLQNQRIDLAIRFSSQDTLDNPEQIELIPAGEDKVYPVCSPTLLKEMNIKSPADLLRCPKVSFSNAARITWRRWFESQGIEYSDQSQNTTLVESTDLALSAVLGGHGVTLASSAMFAGYVKSGLLVVPFAIPHEVTWRRFIAYDAQSPKIERIRLFSDWLESELKQVTTP